MTAARDQHDTIHRHPEHMTCVACIVAGIDVAPTEAQAAQIRLAGRVREVA